MKFRKPVYPMSLSRFLGLHAETLSDKIWHGMLVSCMLYVLPWLIGEERAASADLTWLVVFYGMA